MNFVCDFGNSHPASGTCGCQKKYKVLSAEFRLELVKMFGKFEDEQFRGKTRKVMKPLYPSDITDNMRDHVLASLAQKQASENGPTTFEILDKRGLA